MSSNRSKTTDTNDRARQLLNPKSFLKAKGSLDGKGTSVPLSKPSPMTSIAGMVHDQPPSSGLSSRFNGASSSPSRIYNPMDLLNPKGVKVGGGQKSKAPSPYQTTASSHSDSKSNDPDAMPEMASNIRGENLRREQGSQHAMLERLHGVEYRTEQPRKRVKTTAEDKGVTGSKPAFAYRSNGIVGDYMKPDPGTLPLATGGLVDLTNDDDDEIQITGSRDILAEEEVCYGHVGAVVLAYLTPKPKQESRFAGPNEWGAMKCLLSRQTVSNDNTVIEVTDPCGKMFGRISPELAIALAPAMDGLANLRTQGRLLTRKKRAGDWPHQPCSEQLRMYVNIYGQRGDAMRIGKLFGQHNIWFRPPIAADLGISTCNPHATQKPVIQQNRDSRGHVMAENRTVEEATQAISKLFDHFASEAAPLKSTEAPASIVTPLLEHQKQALTFLLQHEKPRQYGTGEAENTSLWRLEQKASGQKIYKEVLSGMTLSEEPEQVYGGLLADVMGLGKTLEALALIASTVDEAAEFGGEKIVRAGPEDAIFKCHSGATLLVSPLSTIKNWEDQITDHIKPGTLRYYIYHGSNRTSNPFELAKYDIIITTYGTIAAECSAKSSKVEPSPIRQIKWFRIILDEAHTIREPRAAQSQAIYSLWAQRRWCLTGTPIQNRIDDLGSLTRFLRLYPYDNAARFSQYIRSPAQSGDASFLKALRVFVDSFTLRRLKDRVDLPERQDLVVSLPFSTEEKKLHDFFKEISRYQVEEIAKKKEPRSGIQHHVLQGIMTLRLICAHGKELLKAKDLEKLKGISPTYAIDLEEVQEAPSLTKKAALEAFSLMAEASVDLCRHCDKQLSGESPDAENNDSRNGVRCHVLPCLDVVCNDCFEPYKEAFKSRPNTELVSCPFCQMAIGSQFVSITGMTAEELDTAPDDALPVADQTEVEPKYYGGPHTKTRALLADIKEMNRLGESLVAEGEPPIKCVVFSEFTSHLDLIGRALADNGHTFVRIDGSMTLNKRKQVLDALSTDDDVTILLASIKAAGQGLNLTACSRAFIMEPMWNPAAEAQAVDRIHRIGQTRNVVVKRYQMEESIEGKIVELQKKKQALADVSMNRNHKQLSKKEIREQHMKDIVALFK